MTETPAGSRAHEFAACDTAWGAARALDRQVRRLRAQARVRGLLFRDVAWFAARRGGPVHRPAPTDEAHSVPLHSWSHAAAALRLDEAF